MKNALKYITIVLIMCVSIFSFAACSNDSSTTVTVLKLTSVIIEADSSAITTSDVEIWNCSISSSGSSVYGSKNLLFSEEEVGEKLNTDFYFQTVSSDVRLKYFGSNNNQVRLIISVSLMMNNEPSTYDAYNTNQTHTLTEENGKYHLSITVFYEDQSGSSKYGDITLKLTFEKEEIEV